MHRVRKFMGIGRDPAGGEGANVRSNSQRKRPTPEKLRVNLPEDMQALVEELQEFMIPYNQALLRLLQLNPEDLGWETFVPTP